MVPRIASYLMQCRHSVPLMLGLVLHSTHSIPYEILRWGLLSRIVFSIHQLLMILLRRFSHRLSQYSHFCHVQPLWTSATFQIFLFAVWPSRSFPNAVFRSPRTCIVLTLFPMKFSSLYKTCLGHSIEVFCPEYFSKAPHSSKSRFYCALYYFQFFWVDKSYCRISQFCNT